MAGNDLIQNIILTVGPLVCGWTLDRIFGDPERLPHPVVWFGKAIAFFEHRLNRGVHRFLKGALTAVSLVVGVFLLSWAILQLVLPVPVVYFLLATIGVFYCLAGKTLSKEVRMVFDAFKQGLEAARRQIARIVGRDTASLGGQEIKTAALETLAENLSDGVVAPVFWYMLLGLPGMLAYKMVNTLDSMIGYRNARYRDFGCFAARLDDVANYIPARLTALLMVVASGRLGLWRFVRRFGRSHASPNSGYPEAALAGVLNCRFGGTHDYFGEAVYKPYIGENPRELTTDDMLLSLRLCLKTEILAVALTCTVIAVVNILM